MCLAHKKGEKHDTKHVLIDLSLHSLTAPQALSTRDENAFDRESLIDRGGSSHFVCCL